MKKNFTKAGFMVWGTLLRYSFFFQNNLNAPNIENFCMGCVTAEVKTKTLVVKFYIKNNEFGGLFTLLFYYY